MPVLYAGMDKDFYPGDEAMSWLRTETNLRWTGYYLPVAGPGLASKKTWGGTYSTLRAMHWGIAPLYVGKPRNSVKLAQNRGRERFEGWLDGVEACSLASHDGIKPCVLYFDLEGPLVPAAPWMDYFAGWVEALLEHYYAPGIYCSPLVAPAVVRELKKRIDKGSAELEVWAAAYKAVKGDAKSPDGIVRSYATPEPSASGFAGASSWQYNGNRRTYWQRTLPGGKKKAVEIKLDLNSSLYGDPAHSRAMVELER